MTLAGSSPYIVGLGGRAAIALGTLMALLMVLPAETSPGRLLIALVGLGALVIGVVLLRMRERIPMASLDVALVFGDGLLVFLGRYDGPLVPAFPGIYLVIGTIIFAGRAWWVVAGHIALLGASYAGVLVVGPRHYAPVSRWVIVMTVLVTTGIFLRWLVLVVAGLARAERDARDAAELAAAELEEVGRAKNVFLARMSHELRTPLNVILGFADLLSGQRVGPLNARQAEYVGDVGDSARHLVALVDDVLDLATVSSGGVRLNCVLFDVSHVIEDSVTLVRDQAARKGLVIEVDVAPEVGAIEADRVKVRQVLVNLLANAVKFTPAGGRITVRAGGGRDRVTVAVADTGIGIDSRDIERIFEEFAQTDRRQAQDGTGLGLPLARRFVELHGGRLDVTSTPGQGSRFTFTLPRHSRLGTPVPVSPAADAGLTDHSAFTRPGSAANRTLITRIASRLLVVCGLLATVVAAISPGDVEDRLVVGGSGLVVGVVVAWAGARLPRPSFKQIEWAGWAAVAGISAVTFFAGHFANLTPIIYGWVTMVALALWPRSRALIIVAGVGIAYTLVLVFHTPSNAAGQWLAIITLLTFNGEVVSWIISRHRRLVVAEQEAHRHANRVRAQLAATSQHRSAFVANMSHELRTPLNAIIGFSDLLAESVVGPLNERQREYVQDIQDAARNLLTIVNEVLDSAKVDAGQMKLVLDVIGVRALLENVVNRSYQRGNDRIEGVRLDISADVDFIVADRERLQQVLVQLVSNAVKFTPDGGHVEVMARSQSNGELHISVTDSGIGILPDQVGRIFEPFHQGTRMPTHHVPTGTGLGLSLARSLVELHGGRIWVQSEPDQGSTFTVALPVVVAGVRNMEPTTGAMR